MADRVGCRSRVVKMVFLRVVSLFLAVYAAFFSLVST